MAHSETSMARRLLLGSVAKESLGWDSGGYDSDLAVQRSQGQAIGILLGM